VKANKEGSLCSKVQKVTAVVGSGVTATVLPGIANVVGAHQTLISNLLLPPIRPKSEIEGGAGNMFVFVLLLLVGSPGLIAGVGGITELRTGVSDAINFIALLPVGIFFLVGAFFILQKHLQNRRTARTEFQNKIRSWERSFEAWKQLFYCARCDGVFIAGKSPFIPMDEKDRFLSQF
jgi:hypothetical protein